MDQPGFMTLRNDHWCCLRCKRIPVEELEPLLDVPFTLLPALEDGYFSDISISSSNGKQVLKVLFSLFKMLVMLACKYNN